MADFTSRFNELLTRHEGNDTDLGVELGVSKQTISAWRTGTRSPKKPHIVAIAKYFNVGIPWLMGISDYETESGYDMIRRGFSSETRSAQMLRELGEKLAPSPLLKEIGEALGSSPELKEMNRAMLRMSPEERQKMVEMGKVLFPQRFGQSSSDH